MFLSNGSSSVATPINSGVIALDDSKIYLQANLANNLTSATLVSGNSNVVADTRGTGSWKFYVANDNSIASITAASNSTEWTGGSLLTYVGASASPPTDYSLYYTFDTNKVSGTTITDSVSNLAGTLVGATIATTSPSPAPGSGYLSIVNTYSPSPITSNHFALPSITPPVGGMTLSFWINPRENRDSYIIQIGNGQFNNNIIFFLGGVNLYGIVIKGGTQGPTVSVSPSNNINVTDGTWKHVVWTLNPTNEYKFYLNGSLSNTLTGATYYYPNNVTTTQNYIGRSSYAVPYYNGDFDDFRIYNRILTSDEAYSVFMAGAQSKFNDSATGVTWIPTPAVPVNSSETSYTVKSNEIALTPGTNSTYAVWTATKSTNIKVDVSFADYHSRSAGVGFQMFKIKSDNTFDSVLFPRTVTSTALTNAAPTNYLTVPSVSTTVAAGDKIYIRVDANGNTTAASSVLATTIFTDAVSIATNPVETRILQANLASNLNATTFVSGNANVVNDTAGTSNWQFYVAPSTSVAAITSSSASSEWMGGTLLSANDAFAGTLLFGATYVADAGSRVPGKNYLKLVNSTGSAKCASISPFTPTTNGISFSFWIRHTPIDANNGAFFFNFRDANNVNQTFIGGSFYFGAPGFLSVSNNSGNPESTGIPFSSVGDGNWHHIAWTMTYSASNASTWKFYLDGVVSAGTTLTSKSYMNLVTRTYHNIGNYNDQGDISYAINGGVDNFRVYQKVLSDAEVLADVADTVNLPTQLSDSISQSPVWKLKPAIAVNSAETLYTIKSNEIALIPGANSTYAVWTSPKTTNVKIDVSFADYHSRSAGVGFQMFKVNADNTFGSVIFPRTVTSTALTNANPNNYLSVPSRTISVAAGDKIYYRVDANGNPTSASSVLSTNIYVDPNPDLKQPNLLQAHLGNNMAATTFVSGNSNVVADTRGTGSWKFYVAGGNSIASITGASNSTEWTGGSLLSAQYAFDGTLMNGATYSFDSGSRVPGKQYLKLDNNPIKSQFAKFNQFEITSGGMSFSFWVKIVGGVVNSINAAPFFVSMRTPGNLDIGLFPELTCQVTGGYKLSVAGLAATIKDGSWHHIVVTISGAGVYKFYLDNLLRSTQNAVYPALGTRTNNNLGSTDGAFTESYVLNGGIDNFRIFRSELTALEVTNEYNNNNYPTTTSLMLMTDAGVAPSWMPTPATPVDSSETDYTVKSNEIALRPGANSTYAVWTATKSTNLKIDVSFADYHTRNVGVGFQMFKIKSDNTFDSVLFPRTVTSTALTNAAPNNYLPVPSVSTSVSAGDKIYLRVDANGNTTAASSVLATTIFTDAVSAAPNPVENRLLQAHLGNNLNATTFVSGNANVVLDTLGTSNWQFYAASSTSVAAITSASASTEWTGGSLLSYDLGNPLISSYSFDTTTQSGNTIQNTKTNAYDLTLINGATIGTVNPSPYSSLNSGYLTFNMSAGQYATSTTPVSFSRPFTISVWVRYTGTYPNMIGSVRPTLIEIGDANKNSIMITAADFATTNMGLVLLFTGGVYAGGFYYRPTSGNATVWNHFVFTFNSSNNTVASYVNGVLYDSQTITWNAPASFTYLNFGKTDIPSESNPTTGSWTPCIDKFQIFNVSLSASQVSSLYNNTFVAVDNPTLKNTVAGVIWKPFPATVVDDTETSYTVKSNEVALTPGTNSTFAVWTAPKSTNIRVDVSFADYHSRNVGVGFQMFKINADNTFGSVIYPRTVTSTALTNANPNNYLSVPSRTISVATGDKIYYRLDANGNPTSASSVLATTIYVDPNQDLKQYNVLQANLGNNMAATTFVSGNSNVVSDTRGTGNWQFYVNFGNTITSAITASSSSREWSTDTTLVKLGNENDNVTVSPFTLVRFGDILTNRFFERVMSGSFQITIVTFGDPAPGTAKSAYAVTGGFPLTYFPTIVPVVSNYLLFYTFGSDKVSGTTVYDTVTNYAGTLVNGATIAVDANSRISGQGYLKLNSASLQYMSIPSFTPATGGISFSFWFYLNGNPEWGRMFDFSNGGSDNIFCATRNGYVKCGVHGTAGGNITPDVFVIPSNNVWCHLVWTIASNGTWIVYLNGTSVYNVVNYYPPAGTRSSHCYFGNSNYSEYYKGGIDNFRYYNYVLSPSNVTSIYNSGDNDPVPAIFKNDTTGVAWMPSPAAPVNSSELSYTVKSNEIALTPGTNSTYAVWTATKSTNLKIDVSFADYHTRSSAGVGFQMFKIKSDNTFDSVLFPRTVTSTALTNAAPNNYLPVPSVSTSVSAGDKIYLRVDANGNTTAASSVLATTIFTDAVSAAPNPVENRLLQANLASNLNATTLVSGNANTVLDTVGNGDWKFYVAGGNSIAAISSASNSTEWTGGSLLSYSDLEYSMFYPFNTNTVSGSTVLNMATNTYDLTLYNGASIINTVPFPASQPQATGSGYLSMNVGDDQHAKASPSYLFNPLGSTISFWVRWTSNVSNAPIFSYGTTSTSLFLILLVNSTSIQTSVKNGESKTNTTINNYVSQPNQVYITLLTATGGVYLDGVFIGICFPLYGAGVQPNYFYFGTYDSTLNNIGGFTYDMSVKTGTISVDNFVVFNKTLTASEVMSLYSGSSPPSIKDSATGVTWIAKPAIAVDSTETLYTIKSNEIALTPGTNSTYAVWTAPKSTNIRVDVSFADYHSRTAGVGFQMFKINNDNTFGSTIFPRTVTSTALTNAAPNNYLNVPSVSLSVTAGDKVYYRIDANGNTTSASSVISTNIYSYSGKWN